MGREGRSRDGGSPIHEEGWDERGGVGMVVARFMLKVAILNNVQTRVP